MTYESNKRISSNGAFLSQKYQSPRKKSRADDQPAVRDDLPDGVNHRTSLAKLVEINRLLNQPQHQAIETRGFGPFTKLKIKKFDRRIMALLIQNFNPITRELSLHGKVCTINKRTLEIGMGLPSTSVPLEPNTGAGMYDEYLSVFKGAYQLGELQKKLQDVIKSGSNDTEFSTV